MFRFNAWGLCLLIACITSPAIADEVHELQSAIEFQTQGQNIWRPTENDNLLEDGAAFDRVEETLLKVDILNIQTPDIGSADYQSLGEIKDYNYDFSGATRVKDVDIACDDEAGEYLYLDGCYTCPNGQLDLAASVLNGEATCIDYKDAQAVATPSIDACPAGHDLDVWRNKCYEICDSGYAYKSSSQRCEEKLVIPELSNKTCSSGELYLGECKSCPSGYSLNALGVCTRAQSKDTMDYCGKRYWDSCDTKILGVCVGGWDYSLGSCNSTRIRKSGSNNYYDCPTGFKHNSLVSFNNNGICYKNYSDKSASTSTPSCSSSSLDIGVSCVSCPDDAPYNSSTEQCGGRSYAANYAAPIGWGCPDGTYDLDAPPASSETIGQCLACSGGYDYNSKLGEDNCSQTSDADYAGVPVPDLSCPAGTYYDVLGGDPGCFSCPSDMTRTLLPIDSEAACFGLVESGSSAPTGQGSVELGIQIDAEFALRFGISGEIVLDGGSVDVDLSARPKVSITRIGESYQYAVSTSLDEQFTELGMNSTWPTMDGYIDTHTESYSYLGVKFGVVGFDETTGLPTNDVVEEVLIDSRTGDPLNPDAERFYGRPDVSTDRRHLYHAHVGYDPAIGEYDRYTRWTLPSLFDISLPFDFDLDFDFGFPDYLQSVTSSLAVPVIPGIFSCGNPCLEYIVAEGWVNETNLNIPPPPGFVGHFSENVIRSPRGDGISIRQELGRNPPEPLSDFDVPLPQTVDFTRLDLDLDGIVSKLTAPSTPLGIQYRFKKLGKTLLRMDGSQLDIDFSVLFSAEKNLQFEPNMDFIMTFSRPVLIRDSSGEYTTDQVQMPVGENFNFERLDGEPVEVDISYTVARNVFSNDTNLLMLPMFEGEVFSLSWDFIVKTPGLPNKWTLLTVPYEISDPISILDIDETRDDGIDGEARFTLGGFNVAAGGTISLPALNAAPVAVCRDATVHLNNEGSHIIDSSLVDDGSYDPDNGDSLIFTFTPAELSCGDLGFKGVALTVTDQQGAASTCVSTIDVTADKLSLIVVQPGQIEATANDGTEVTLDYVLGGGCGSAGFEVSPNLEVYPLGDTEVTVTATDSADSRLTETITVSVVDTTPPVFAGLPLGDIEVEATGTKTQVSLPEPVVGDIFPITSLTNDAPATGYDYGTPTVVTWTAVDANGNQVTAEQIVTVRDTTAPELVVPEDIVVEATAVLTPVPPGEASSSDLFDVTVTNDALIQYPGGFPVGTSTVTWTADDGNGNVTVLTQQITVQDTTPPEITLAPIESYEASAVNSELTLKVPLAADIFSVTLTSDAPSSFPLGDTDITWTAEDVNGNQSISTQVVRVLDTTAPTLSAPANVTAEATAERTVVATGDAEAEDIFLVSVESDAPDTYPAGDTQVTWTATDSSGNSTIAQQTVSVVDTTNPELTVPADLTVEATATETPVAIGEAGATDIFLDRVEHNAPEAFPLGETIVAWTATDTSDNSISGEQRIVVKDTTAPVVSAPADLVIEATAIETLAAIGNAEVTDIFPDFVGHDGPEAFPLGVTTITWTATDTSGNQGNDQQRIMVADTTSPVMVLPADVTIEAAGERTIVSQGIPTAMDIFAVTVTGNAPADYPLGTTTVNWAAIDVNGNESRGTQQVTVIDSIAPQLQVPDNIVIEGNVADGAEVQLPEVTANDAVDANPVVACSAPSGFFPLGVTTVTCSATDQSGNQQRASFNVNVLDTTPPQLSVVPTVEQLWPANHKYVAVGLSIDASDTVDGSLEIVGTAISSEMDDEKGGGDGKTTGDIRVNQAGGAVVSSNAAPVVWFDPVSGSLELRAERAGKAAGRSYAISITATDAAGNATTSEIVVSVPANGGKSTKSAKSAKSAKSIKSVKSANHKKSEKNKKSQKKGKG